jgi:hypothetical protein
VNSLPEQQGQDLGRPIEALIVTGDAVRSLSGEQVVTLGSVLLQLGLEVTPVYDLEKLRGEADSGEQEPKPVPTTQEDFVLFGDEHGYSRTRAYRAFRCLRYTSTHSYRDRFPDDPYPQINFLGSDPDWGPDENLIVDLRTVKDRLDAAGLARPAWGSYSKPTIEFIAHIVNEKLGAEREEI